MAHDYDDLYDDDEDLDEDEREDRREERRYFEQAKAKMGERRREAEARFLSGLFQSGVDYLKQEEDEPPMPWLIENFIPCGSLVILGGNSKSGKTCLATALAMAVAKGEPFLGEATRQSPVLWCAFEESRQERLALLGKFGDLPEHFYTSHGEFKIDSEMGEKAFNIWTAWLSMPLIVVDPLFGATDANLSEGRAARKALMGLKRLAARTLATVIVIHHVNKDVGAGLTRERFAESNQLLATASMDLLMDSKDLPDGAREIRLQGRGRGDHANRTWLLRSTGPTDFEVIGDGHPGARKDDLRAKAVTSLLGRQNEAMSAEELAAACGLQPQSTRNLLAQMHKEGRIVLARKQGRTRFFQLA